MTWMPVLQPLGLLPRRMSTLLMKSTRKEEVKIPSQDSIDLFSIETSSVPKFRVQFNPTVNHSPRELQGKINRNHSPFRFTRYHRVNLHPSGIWSKTTCRLRAYDLNTHTDSNCRKLHRQSLEVYGVFGVHAKGKGSSRSVVRVDRRANSERTVRRVLLPEFCTNQAENKPLHTRVTCNGLI